MFDYQTGSYEVCVSLFCHGFTTLVFVVFLLHKTMTSPSVVTRVLCGGCSAGLSQLFLNTFFSVELLLWVWVAVFLLSGMVWWIPVSHKDAANGEG